MNMPRLIVLNDALASKFAQVALGHLTREYPNKLDHVMASAADVQSPRALHPVFYGSFDWHSCVHGYWLLARLVDRFPALPEAARIRSVIDEHFTDANVAAEVAYLERPAARGFERPYGWAWLLALAGQLRSMHTEEGARWARTLQPLADAFVARFVEFLPKSTYPLRVGTHFNMAFALTLALGYARVVRDGDFERLLVDTATRWFANDEACQAWEPAGDEFLSPSLMEAVLMRHVLPDASFNGWLERFLPRLAVREPATLFVPATVTDRSDGKLAHLDGLNLSRAWCQRTIARALPAGDARIGVLDASADEHLAAGIAHVAGDYMGEHWLATFALLALEA
ncbi:MULTISPECIES: DUF2891 domain-containing protein [unclassified Caballeronia]|uniref:DUF2891 domain-containing protein n=2 Tax=unclassified Caballeronia TaxID=2646786 RepID=UPI00202928BF|nr:MULTISPECIES: DUF2891 domain-containing protein [unclassified Caballeronia]MDR5775164.1 DUF2891 domain-containing protein [Caballeronia sp. LZ002]MDR5850602.1 DUF2891 domain-containing protein [Caballeronia sp. LZ003]